MKLNLVLLEITLPHLCFNKPYSGFNSVLKLKCYERQSWSVLSTVGIFRTMDSSGQIIMIELILRAVVPAPVQRKASSSSIPPNLASVLI